MKMINIEVVEYPVIITYSDGSQKVSMKYFFYDSNTISEERVDKLIKLYGADMENEIFSAEEWGIFVNREVGELLLAAFTVNEVNKNLFGGED